MTNLIQTLNQNQTKTPDQIVTLLQDPFHTWRQAKTLTQDEFEQYGDTSIVVCHDTYRERPLNNVELNHFIGQGVPTNYYMSRWEWHDYTQGVFSTNSFWFRSRTSYDANPTEGF